MMGLFSRKKEAPGPIFPSSTTGKLDTFEDELTALVNKYSLEALSNTPDFILAYYLKDCLLAFNSVQQRRKEWFSAREEFRASQLAELAVNTQKQ